MESGERFWMTKSQLREREPIEIGQELDVEELRQWLLLRQYPMALNNAVELLAQRGVRFATSSFEVDNNTLRLSRTTH